MPLTMSLISIAIYIFYAYLLIGLGFAIWFVFSGVHRVDAGMRESTWKLRLLLLPGAMALWVFLLPKYLKSAS